MAKKRHKTFFSTELNTSFLSITLVLVLLGTIVLFYHSAQNFSSYLREHFMVTVLIDDGIDSLKLANLSHDIENAEYVKSYKYISKDEAMKEEIKILGSDPSEFLDENPFIATFEIYIKSDYHENGKMEQIVKKLKNTPGVLEVEYSKDVIKNVNYYIRIISIVLLVIAGLFTYISFALINNTVRLAIFSRRFSINTMKLVGASWNFIRWPFLKRSIVMGFVSAVSASLIIFIGIYWLWKFMPQSAVVIDWKVIMTVSFSVFVFGITISVLCTLISLNKYLKMNTNKLYYI